MAEIYIVHFLVTYPDIGVALVDKKARPAQQTNEQTALDIYQNDGENPSDKGRDERALQQSCLRWRRARQGRSFGALRPVPDRMTRPLDRV